MTCAFTGHRPEKLPWGTRESDPRCQALTQTLRQTVAELAGRGYSRFLCGMARGCDLLFFDAVRAVQAEQTGIRLVAVVPCASQARSWPPADRARYQAALLAADEVQLLAEHYYRGCMQIRNRHMVDQADLLLSVWDGSPGGTGSTVAYARRQGVPVRAVWR